MDANRVFLASACLLVLICPTTWASCSKKINAEKNLQDKLSAVGGYSAGADYMKGAKAANIYLFVDVANAGAFGRQMSEQVKPAIHEYIHVLQQGLQSGFITSLTPPTDTLGVNRFQSKPFGNVPSFFADETKKLMDLLPGSLKLLTIPTYIILIPQVSGGVGSANLAANVATLMELTYNTTGGCPGVDFNFNSNAQSNQIIAEGSAEYFDLNNYYNTAVAAWPNPKMNGPAEWTQQITDHTTNFLDSTPSKRTDFHIGSGTSAWTDKMTAAGLMENPAGELAFAYLMKHWRNQTTHADILQIWLDSATMGYGPAFKQTMGKEWSTFVCGLEDYYVVTSAP